MLVGVAAGRCCRTRGTNGTGGSARGGVAGASQPRVEWERRNPRRTWVWKGAADTRKGGSGKCVAYGRTEIGSGAAMEMPESAMRECGWRSQADGCGGTDSGGGVRVTRGRAAIIVQAAAGAVSVPTEGGGGRSRPAVEAEPLVPSLRRSTRANSLKQKKGVRARRDPWR